MSRLLFTGALLLAACSTSEGGGVSGDAGSAACGSCHTTELAAWKGSPLATSGTSPVFRALKSKASTAWGEEAASECQSCHQPASVPDHAIGCVACHSATGNLATRDGLLVVDPSQPVSGPFDDAVPTPAHGSRTDPFLASPDLCGTCHELTGPRLFTETTLTEFQSSGATTCVECHLPAVAPGPIAGDAGPSRARVDHSFVGIDPAWGATPSVAAATQERTLVLLQSSVRLTVIASDGGYDLAIQNLAGHDLPTGVTFLRSMWVDAVFTEADGHTTSVPEVVVLSSQPMADGRAVPLVTMADTVVARGVAAGTTKTVHLEAPLGVVPSRVDLTLRARAIRDDALSALGLDARAAEVPTHDVATAHAP